MERKYMKALISPNEMSPYLESWTYNPRLKTWEPVYADVPDSWRVAQVQETTFEVASPLFWTDCADNVVADEWYYQTSTGLILQIPAPAPIPSAPSQQTTEGAQTL
jgi:hypothetical protein